MATETPERRRRPILRILAIVGFVLLAIAALTALSWALRTTERDSVSITESYDQVEVDVSIGEIVIEAVDSDETTPHTARSPASGATPG
jgi:flagellar basal body-associated protein FliL